MAYEITWTRIGLESLEHAVRRIATDKPFAAETFRESVNLTVDPLALFPQLGQTFEAEGIANLRELFCEPYRIYYRVLASKSSVQILLLWHASREDPSRADLLS